MTSAWKSYGAGRERKINLDSMEDACEYSYGRRKSVINLSKERKT